MRRGVVRILYRALCMLVIAFTSVPPIAGAEVNQANKLFIASTVNNRLPYTGQEILLTYTLYFKEVAPKISNETAPLLKGVWTKETVPERFIKSSQISVKGELLRYAVVKQFKLVPLQSGKITLSGYSILCNLPQDQGASGFQEKPETHVRITAPDVVISVRALPEPVPAGFAGAIGTFKQDLVADKLKLRTGEPLSLKLLLTGTGSLLTLKLPDIHLPASFRQNPPEITTSLPGNSVPSTGTITATITAWPQSAGEYEIAPLRTVTFNPDTKQYSTLISKPISISVAPASEGTANKAEPRSSVTEKTSFMSPLLIVTALALLFLMTRATTILLRRKQLNPEKGKGQTGIDTTAGNLKLELFLLLEKAGIKSPGGLTRVELKNALQEIGLPLDVQAEIPAVLDSLDRILYSPTGKKEASAPDSLVERVNSLRKALSAIGSAR